MARWDGPEEENEVQITNTYTRITNGMMGGPDEIAREDEGRAEPVGYDSKDEVGWNRENVCRDEGRKGAIVESCG